MFNKQNTIKNIIKQKQGITLIALIVTIIVLLILAGITVATLTGDNGLLTKTSEAQFRTEIAQYKEELDLSVINDQAETKGNRTTKFNETEYSKIKKLIPSFNRKYENVLVVEEDKLVYKGNDKSLYIKAKDMGMLSENDLLDDEILEELQPFITEWTVEAGDTITLPIGGTCDFTVNYGDGTEELKVTSSTDEDRVHTYTSAGTYTITIKGKLTAFSTEQCDCRDKLTKIVQWGNTGFSAGSGVLRIDACANLKGPIPEPSKNSFVNMTSMEYLFGSCPKLDGVIPEKLFYNCPNVSSFADTFSNCQALSGFIPENLFKNCPNVTSFYDTFLNCRGLSGTIPENLFKNQTKVTSFYKMFNGCSNITGNIPDKLFANCTKVTSFYGTFWGCRGLTGSIPENIFKNCTEVDDFSYVFAACSGFTGNIPDNLFANCTKVTKFNGTFSDWREFKGSIPENLFKNCVNATSFNETFFRNYKMIGSAPSLWQRDNVTKSTNCFGECVNLSNYNQIPSSWGGGGE